MTKAVIQLAMLWKLTKSNCVTIIQRLQIYIATKVNNFMVSLDPISFWKTTLKFDTGLRHLATMIFKIKGHAASVKNFVLWYVLYNDKDSQPHECGKLENVYYDKK